MNPTDATSRVSTRASKLVVALLCLGVAALLLAFAAAAYADPPTTTAEELAGWQGSAFTINLNCSAGTSSGDELYATKQRMDWETDFTEKLWSDNVIGGRVWVMYSFVHYDGVHQCYFYSVGHNNNTDAYEQEATKSMTVKIDTTAPTTTIANVPAGWSKGAVIATFSAADALSGVAATEYSLDGGASWKAGSSTMVIKQGTCTLLYRSRDAAGNTEATQSATVRIDSIRPVPRALSNVTGRRGKSVRLPYRVNDAAAPQATVTIKIFKAGRRVKLLSLGSKTTNTTLTCSYRCPLAKGTYVWKVYATDLAGNTQAVASSRKLSVR